MKSTHHISILGCGYLGMEAAKLWRKAGHHVTGTTRKPERLDQIAKVAQKGILFKGTDDAELATLIASSDVFLVTIGADNLQNYENAYRHIAEMFRHLSLEMDAPRRLIYTSSTGIYGDHHGRWVDEESDLLAKSEQAKILIETEQIYQSLIEFGWEIAIVRLGEIYGPGRELSHKLKMIHSPLPGDGHNYTNMIHRADCIGAIDYILRHQLEGIFNLADDDHPTRKELYTTAAAKFHLPEPKWDPKLPSLHTGNKRISNHKIKSAGYTLQFPHRLLD